MLHNETINKDNIDLILETFSDKYHALTDKNIDLYLVGGSSIILNFDYRESTIDIDAFFKESEYVDQAIKETAKSCSLPENWLNQDFVNTPSFSNKLESVSELYKDFKNIRVFCIKPLYLIAMKLKSSRPTGGDLDDIIQMIYELRNNGSDITYDDVMKAYDYLYQDHSNTFESFFRKTKEAFDVPLEEVKEYINHQNELKRVIGI